jgi:hypothetical protein
MRSVILDNEAVQAIADRNHPKHRVVTAHLAGVASRRRRGRLSEAVVPTAVRVEAGWNRTAAAAAPLNRFRIRDHALDPSTADLAASIHAATATGVADAHVGAAARSLPADEVVALTSDPHDMAAVCSPRAVTIITL